MSPMSHRRVLVFQHVPFEGLGQMEDLLRERGSDVIWQPWFAKPDAMLPDPEAIDLLIVMGGPMSIHDETAFPWLRREKAWLRRALDADLPMLGICLGGQLIADALGAEVKANPIKEIGWFPVEWTPAGQALFATDVSAATVLHWHGETFSLPEGAQLLASSAVCEQQGYRYGDRVVGLQFHLEMRPEDVTELIENSREELVDGDWIQSEVELVSIPDDALNGNRAMLARLLDRLLA